MRGESKVMLGFLSFLPRKHMSLCVAVYTGMEECGLYTSLGFLNGDHIQEGESQLQNND